MNDAGSSCTQAKSRGIVQRLRRWWRPGSAEEQYLVGATDVADLERRMRVLDRASGGPAIVTLDH
jgi:hypothetical protein